MFLILPYFASVLPPDQAKAQEEADAVFAKAERNAYALLAANLAKAYAVKAKAYDEAGLPPPPEPVLASAELVPRAVATASSPGRNALNWKQRARINHAKSPAWPATTDHYTSADRRVAIKNAIASSVRAARGAAKRMRELSMDENQMSRPHAIPCEIANILDGLEGNVAGVIETNVP